MRRILCLLTAASFIASPVMADSPAPVEAANGMAVSSQHYASEAGAAILQAGGNAIDAAVAVGYALAVVHPCCGNIGGGGFATIHLANGKETFIDFREKAPAAATQDMYLDAAGNVVPHLSTDGYKAVAVPGSVMGFEMMLKKYGSMTRAQVMAPAIKLAEQGYVLSPGDVGILATRNADFAKQPEAAAIWLNHGQPWKVGETVVQKDLASTLREIEAKGPDAFYKGEIAARVAAASQAHGGILTVQDFADYTAEETAPLTCSYRGYKIVSSPPPSSGGTTICEITKILAAYPMDKMEPHSEKSIHLMVEAMRHAYVDRNFKLGDPDFIHNPISQILSDSHIAAIRAKIDPVKATPSAQVQPGVPPHEGANTTHFSVVDRMGNAVSVTYTINAYFGANVIAGDTGFFLNDEMDDFTSKVGSPNMFGLIQGDNNAIAPGKRPLSSMSPTVVSKNGKVMMVVGSPGGSRIITITLEAMLNVIDHHMDVESAIDYPRIHMQWMPDVIELEQEGIAPDVRAALAADGYTFKDRTHWGAAEGIVIADKNGKRILYGANDKREPAGAAVGY